MKTTIPIHILQTRTRVLSPTPPDIHVLSHKNQLNDDLVIFWLPEMIKLLLFGSAWLIFGFAVGMDITITMLIAPVFAFALLFLFNAWRARVEHKEIAWQLWIDQVRALVLQRESWQMKPCWQMYFRKGYTPQRAVKAYLSIMIECPK